MNFLYFGTPEFSRIVLEELLKSGLKTDGRAHIGFKPVAVVTAPDKPVGRKQVLTESPVAAFAKENGIEVLKPEKIKPPEFIPPPSRIPRGLAAGMKGDFKSFPRGLIPRGKVGGFIEKLKSFEPDLIVVAAYGKIIPQAILDIPKHGSINVHPSLLPKWRGASPIPYAILNGDAKTGVTIMLMDVEMDHGPILTQEEVVLKGDETTATLAPELARIGGRMLTDVIPRWLAGQITPREQDHRAATYTKILTKEDGRIDWSKSAIEIERHVRAFDPWPGAWTVWPRYGQDIILKLLAVRIPRSPLPSRHPARSTAQRGGAKDPDAGDSSPFAALGVHNDRERVLAGTVLREGIATGNGLIEPLRLQLAGKRPMSWPEFLRGHQDFVRSVLG